MAETAERRIQESESFQRLKTQYPKPSVDEHGMSHRDRFLRRKLALGLFLPSMSGGGGGYYPSDLSLYAPTWEYNLACAKRCDEMGFDFIFPVGRWCGDRGPSLFNEFSQDVVSLTAGLAAHTKRCMVFTTWHISYHFHPMHVAKIGAGIDHISGGRWGLNVVTGWKEREVAMFGRPFAPREERYRLGDEFVSMVKQLWTTDEMIDLDGEYFKGRGCRVLPKPLQEPHPLIINAGQSKEGIDFATNHCDVIFILGGSGAQSSDLDEVSRVVERVRAAAKEKSRSEVKVLLPVVLIARDSEKEALAFRQKILDHADYEAAENMRSALLSGSGSYTKHTLEEVILGIGGFKVFGTPEQALEAFSRLSAAGVDGIQLVFFDYLEDLDYFAEGILPLLEEAGLREVR